MIQLKSTSEILKMKNAGKYTAMTLDYACKNLEIGMSTQDIDDLAYEYIKTNFKGAVPSFLNFNGYPGVLCISINEEVVHGIPSKFRKIKEGDILSLDCGIFFDSFHGDSAVTVAVGSISKLAQKLIDVTKESLEIGIKKALAEVRLGDVSFAIQDFVERNGFSVVRDFVGHGIGRSLHEEPEVPNFGEKGQGIVLKEGMTLAIEPMVCIGKPDIKILDNKWTAVSVDGSLSAHFEHTIAITKFGNEVLTKI